MLMLAGAQTRLLPPAVPAAFFTLACLCQALFWALTAWAADHFSSGTLPGTGPGMGALHTLTVGVLVATACGAAIQILPVVTQQKPPPPALAGTIAALLAVGLAAFVGGNALAAPTLILWGGSGILAATLVQAGVMAALLRRARVAALAVTTWALWGALASLLGLAGLAALLLADAQLGVLPDHSGAAMAHAVLAIFGFMGLLVFGLSEVLVPMLAIAEPNPAKPGRLVLVLAAIALILAETGLLAGLGWLTTAAALAGLAAAALNITQMVRLMKRRLSRDLGPSFILIRASWAMLAAALALSACMAAGLVPADPGIRLAGILLLPGWLLTILTGVLQRIMPFLASMHTVGKCKRSASPASLTWARPLKIHLVLHFLALALALAAAITGWRDGFLAAGAAGFTGGIAFMAFAATVATRTRKHLRKHERT